MGRKGVSKRKRGKEKGKQVAADNSALNRRKANDQPEQVTEKSKHWSKEPNKSQG